MIRLSQRCTSSSAGGRVGSRMLVSALSLWLGACDLSDSTRISLVITAPTASATFTSADDVDPDADGTQIEVSVAAVHVRSGAVIELYRLEAGAAVEPTVATAAVEQGQAVFRAFTLQPGDNALQARLQDADQVSEPVTVRFRDTCGELAFVEPSSDDDDAIRLGPNDDLDAEACGGTFTTRVIASTGLVDGTEVTLLVNGSESRSATTQGGVAKFDDVLLDNRGETPNQLALRVADSACSVVELDADVFVNCDGPSCALGGPKGPDLSSRDDEDVMGAGLQLDFDVQTEPGVAGVQLLINGDIDNARVTDADGGKATFSAVSLPEGTGVRVKAICMSDKGATSVSERLFNVDTTACAVAVTTPLANASFISPQGSPNQQPDASFEIAIAADVGSDCVSYRVGALIGADCAGIDKAEAVPLVAGQGKINSTLTLSTQGEQFACVEVSDAAGNTAYANAQVSFDKRGPQLNIIDPNAALKVNAKGTAGRKADLDTATNECDRPMQVSCDEPGVPVHILTVAGSVQLATATCIGGIASFDSVPLPTQNDGSSYTIRARSTDLNGLVGNSGTRSITADCEAEQVLTFHELSCGSAKIRSTDDQNGDTPDIQFAVKVTNAPTTGPQPTLSLRVDQPAATYTGTPASGLTTFEDVTFTLESQPELEACATDSGGNLSCTAPCPLTVSDL